MSLCMGIFANIEDATITIDEAHILEIKVMIALPFQLRLTSFVEQRRQRDLQKVCCRFRVFFSLIFSFPSSLWSHRRSSLVALHHTKHAIIDVRRFRLKNERSDGKRRLWVPTQKLRCPYYFCALSLNVLERMASQ